MQKGSALALACRPLVFSGVWRSRPPGGGSLWGPGLGPLYALDKLVRACASSPKISWGGHQILPNGSAVQNGLVGCWFRYSPVSWVHGDGIQPLVRSRSAFGARWPL